MQIISSPRGAPSGGDLAACAPLTATGGEEPRKTETSHKGSHSHLLDTTTTTTHTLVLVLCLHSCGCVCGGQGRRVAPCKGFSLTNISSKAFTFIVNKSLTQWTESNDVMEEAQAGVGGNETIFSLYKLLQRNN